MSAFFFVLFILIITSLNWFVVNSMFEAHHFKLDDHYGELGNSISDEENFLSPFPTGHEIRDINLLRRYKSLPDLIVALSAGHGGVIEKPQIRYPDPKKLIFTLQKTHNVKTPDPKLMLTKMLENMLKNSSLDEEKSLIANDVSVNYTRKTDKKLVLGNKEKTSDVDKKLKDILIQYGLSEPDVDVDVSNTIDHKIIIEESEEETDDPTASDQVMVDYIKNIDKTISFEGDDDDDDEEDEDDYIKHNQINGNMNDDDIDRNSQMFKMFQRGETFL